MIQIDNFKWVKDTVEDPNIEFDRLHARPEDYQTIDLLFYGLGSPIHISLRKNGTWIWEDSSGG